jgi:hypothetical protein
MTMPASTQKLVATDEFVVIFDYNPNADGGVTWMNFDVYLAVGKGECGELLFEVHEDRSSPAKQCPTDDIKKARPFVIGNIKWDGCSDWDFSPYPDSCIPHFCSRKSAHVISRIIDVVYDIAAQVMGPEAK